MENDRRRIELLNSLLFSFPGTPIIYYGDELGMGDNIYLGDRYGVRTPMHWSADRNAGFSEADTAALFAPLIVDAPYSYHTVNVAAQERSPTSWLRWMRRLIAVRQQYKAFGRGTWEPLQANNRRVLVFLRRYKDELILCVHNLSRFAQYVELDLRDLSGMIPLELWSKNPFPPIGEWPYLLTLGPHNFLWFRLLAPEQAKEYQRGT
jgi:maltose alpha-D-glucosyltransferase/alpha-amylase